MFLEKGMHLGSMIGDDGCPADSGPPVEQLGDTVTRAPLLRTPNVRDEAVSMACIIYGLRTWGEGMDAVCRHFLEALP